MKTLWKNKFFLACFLLIGAGFFARIFILSTPFEYDEIFTAVTANPRVSLGRILKNYLLPDVHPPLHNIFLWFYNQLLPYGPEWLLRLPSAVAGVVALWLGWRLFPRRFGRLARWVFCVLVAGNYHLILFSQQARPYAFAFLEALPFTFLFLDFMRRLGRPGELKKSALYLYALLACLLCWTHYFGAVLVAVASGLLWARAVYCKKYIKTFLVIPLVVFALFSVWTVPNLLQNISLKRFSGTWWANRMTPLQYWQGVTSVLFFNEYVYGGFMILWLVGLGGGYAIYRRKKYFPHGRDMVWAGLLSGGVIVTAVIFYVCFGMSFFLGRYFIVLLPAFYLLYTLSLLPVLHRGWVKGLLLLLCFFSFAWGVLSAWHTQYDAGTVNKVFSRFYHEHAADKELYIISFTPFPAAALEPMYAFYPTYHFGMHPRVHELTHLDAAALEPLLENRKQAIIFAHNCNMDELLYLSLLWDRAIGIEEKLRSGCFLQVSARGEIANPAWDEPKDEPGEEPKDEKARQTAY